MSTRGLVQQATLALSLLSASVSWGEVFPMSNYNLIVLGDLDIQSEVEGKTLIGGNLTGSAGNFGVKLSIPKSEMSLIVAKNVSLQNVNVNQGSVQIAGNLNSGSNINLNSGGNYEIGGTKSGNVNGGTSLPFSNFPDIDAIANSLKSASATFAAMTATSTTSIQSTNQLIFNAVPTGPHNIAVFNVSASDVFGNSNLASLTLNANGASEIIINVSGTSVSWNNGMNEVGDLLTADLRSKVIWNFYQATSIDIERNFNGALLAPYAHLTNGTAIDGSVAVASFTQRGEVHLPTTIVAVPEVSSSLLLGGLVIPLILIECRRRRQVA